MSPASRSKSKDKRAAASKEPQKSSAKPTSNTNTGGSVSANGYNPLLGTFHTLDTAPISSAPPINGRTHDTDDHSSNSVGIGVEYDSLSNNGSWSGESEDHKEKTTQTPSRHDPIPGVDSDKREKIRQKNEKKHQRQKERRAQELHERCSGYLMSRKLELLSEQLVAMGFSSERATMALILNEGRVEQSVAWLFEGGEDGDSQTENNNNNIDSGGNLKIDISEELAQIADMEIKFKCSKQEVERAVVACEGDLEQAAETLRTQKQEPPPKPEEKENGKLSVKPIIIQNTSTSKTQSKQTSGAIPIQPIQHKMDEKDFNYTKTSVTSLTPEPVIKNVQLLKKTQQVSTQSVEKRWPVSGSNPSLAAPPPATKTETRYTTNLNELKNLHLGSVREPVIVMQRPKTKTSATPSNVVDWHQNVIEPVTNMNPNPNGFSVSHIPTSTRSFNNNTQLYDQFHYQHQQQQQYDHHFSQHGYSNGVWNRMAGGGSGGTTTPSLAPASSLGLFSGNGSSGPSSPVDWNAGDKLQFDYTNIDWSLDRLPVPPGGSGSSRQHGMWIGSTSGGGAAMRPPTGVVGDGGSEGSTGEWTSPFEEKELFGFTRQFVSSPSL